MSRVEALRYLINFIERELRAKKSSACFYVIDGDRLCLKCRSSKRRTLYMIISDDMPVMLKCFRATCTIDYLIDNPTTDSNRARPITRDELLRLGFNNQTALDAILDTSNLVFKKTKSKFNKNLLVTNTVLHTNQNKYLQDRCNFIPTLDDIDKYHIIPNVKEVIEMNDIPLSESMVKLYKYFKPENSLTFSCSDTTLSTRVTVESNPINKSILNISEGIQSLGYRIGDEITKRKILVVSEGIFDIINIERYFATNLADALYIASLGFSKIQNIVEYYFYKNIETLETLILFMDSDIETKVNGVTVFTYNELQLYNLIKYLDMTFSTNGLLKIFVCWNAKSKDCGDFREKIDMRKIEINRKELFKKYSNDYNRSR
ncbi:MAG: hypothetical protein ACRCX2_13545 [Paraclostridium sp.]